MSIGGIMRTSVSGMTAQASKLGIVAENIANSDTTGYKQSQAEFSSLILPNNVAGYNSGAVEVQVRTFVSEQGGLSYTGNDNSPKKLDLAVNGNGFLAVSDGAGGNYLTRAGAFTQQADGSLVNAAGYTLMGYPVGMTGTDAVLNGFAGLQEVNLRTSLLSANPTTKGILTVPLNKDKTVSAATAGGFTQSSVFNSTGGTTASGDILRFNVTVNGGTPLAVDVTSGAGGINAITSAQIVSAINAAHTAAGGTVPIASLDANGFLKLTSPTTGPASSVALANVQQISGTTAAPLTAPTTLNGLSTFTSLSATGKSAVPTPAANTAVIPASNSTVSTSITVYNNAGEAVKLDVYYTKTNDAENTWEMAVYDSRSAGVGPTAPFPYTKNALSTASLDFDNTNYTLQTITPLTGSSVPEAGVLNIDLTAIGGSATFKLDIGDTTQFSGNTQPLAAAVDGNPAEVIKEISIGIDGTVTANFASGTTRDLFKIPLVSVNSPDNLVAKSGNVYSAGIESGTVLMGFGGSGGFGNLTAGALEDSTVDLASELTNMIESQRSYTANSKVFQTGSEILDVLVNLKR